MDPYVPQQQRKFDEYRDNYGHQIRDAISFAGQTHDFYTKVKAAYLLDLFEMERPKGALQVLDVGCGHGLIHSYLVNQRRCFIDLTGVDTAPAVIEIAKKENPIVSYETYDGYSLPFADHSFDFAYAICVMHHVPSSEWDRFLREMKRVVRPGGVVAIFEHNPLNPMTMKVVRGNEIDRDAELLRSRTLKALFQGVGLQDPRARFILFTPFDQSFFHWIDRKLSWLPLGAQYFISGRV